MLKFFFIYVILFLSLEEVKAQKEIKMDNFIIYNNASERSLLTAGKEPKDWLKLGLVSEVNESKGDQYLILTENYITGLHYEISQNKRPEKRLKELFKKIHDIFLKQYSDKASLTDLFESGTYQCVGASILYAYILEHYQIPYQIKETPTHVYVVAYPDTYNILLETTNPQFGYYAPDDKFKQTFIQTLIKEKIVLDDYVKKNGVDKVFNENYYAKTSITLKEAIGLLYYNRALKNNDLEKYDLAYSDISKADILYSVKKNDYLRSIMLDQIMNNFKFNSLNEWQALILAINKDSSSQDHKNFLQTHFQNLIHYKLWESPQKTQVDSVYNFIMLNLNDSLLKTDIKDLYLSENAKYAYDSHNYAIAQKYSEESYQQNPNNPFIKRLLVNIMTEQYNSQKGSLETINSMDSWLAKFPIFKREQEFQLLYVFNYSYISSNAFTKKNESEGEKYLQKLIQELEILKSSSDKTAFDKTSIWTGTAFARAGIYYFNKVGKQKAVETIKKGLRYAPDNIDLNRFLISFNSNKSKVRIMQ